MTTEHRTEEKKESTSLAFSGMTLAFVGLICLFIPGWKSFAVLCASFGLAVSLFSLYRARQTGANKGRAIAGIFIGVLALFTALLIEVMKRVDPPPSPEAIPVELRDTIALQTDEEKALEKLNSITDTAGTH